MAKLLKRHVQGEAPEDRSHAPREHDRCMNEIGVDRWRRTRRGECPSCNANGAGDRCKLCPCGEWGYCFRSSSMFRVHGEPTPERFRIPLPPAPVPLEREKVDPILRAFFSELELSPAHAAHVADRGFLDVARACSRYFSLPARGDARLERALATAKGTAKRLGARIQRVPFVAQLLDDNDHLYRDGGLALPRRDLDGRLASAELRPDKPLDPKHKYLSPRGFPTVCHVGKPRERAHNDAWITEGTFKADLAAERLADVVIGLPGVMGRKAHEEVVSILSRLEPDRAIVAFDADKATNSGVLHAEGALAKRLADAGFDVWIASWPLEAGKGLDDLLVAGGTPVLTHYVPEGSSGLTNKQASVGDPARVPTKTRRRGELTRENRQLLEGVWRISEDPGIRSSTMRAALCGWLKYRKACERFDESPGHTRYVVGLACETPVCPRCGRGQIGEWARFYRDRWKPEGDKVVFGVLKLADDSLATARAARVAAKKRMPVARKSVRFWIAPGRLVMVAPEHLKPYCGAFPDKVTMPVSRAISKIEDLLGRRTRRLKGYLDTRDAVGLSTDPWAGHLHVTSAGKKAAKLFPHPTKHDLRVRARQDSESPKEAPCCGGRWTYEALDAHEHPISFPRTRPYSFRELFDLRKKLPTIGEPPPT